MTCGSSYSWNMSINDVIDQLLSGQEGRVLCQTWCLPSRLKDKFDSLYMPPNRCGVSYLGRFIQFKPEDVALVVGLKCHGSPMGYYNDNDNYDDYKRLHGDEKLYVSSVRNIYERLEQTVFKVYWGRNPQACTHLFRWKGAPLELETLVEHELLESNVQSAHIHGHSDREDGPCGHTEGIGVAEEDLNHDVGEKFDEGGKQVPQMK
ncbi:hypothetical protein H6P81_016471 [Aristolochia fimbriata]|uniref:Uncharacterized protein n=1 Tax=Aristolochia fimbriata TaxID=158543 RepID=A0AAV7E9P8_ARIFI|nr:hypothetical protein H6P81_016471 [Aristolochia fimbriata]